MPLRYYPACIERAADGAFGVFFPDLPGCTSAGSTVQEAATEAAEALALCIAGMVEDEETLPNPSDIDAPLPAYLEEIGPLDIAARGLVPVEVPGPLQRIAVSLPEDLIAAIDRASRDRSRFLAEAAREKLRT